MTLLFITLFALAVGSFINVAIIRIPKNESIVFPSSKCPQCQTPLKLYHNIPLFSWIFLRGKCAFCNVPISKQYPLIEAGVAAIFALLYFKLGLSLQMVFLSFVFTILLALSVIDIRYKAVPDSLNLAALTLAIFAGNSILESLQYALIFAGAFALLRFYVSYIVKQEAMGEADIMIAATMGAVLGFHLTLVAIFLSAMLALPISLYMRISKKDEQVPFIPFLALALAIVFYFNTQFLDLIELIYG